MASKSSARKREEQHSQRKVGAAHLHHYQKTSQLRSDKDRSDWRPSVFVCLACCLLTATVLLLLSRPHPSLLPVRL